MIEDLKERISRLEEKIKLMEETRNNYLKEIPECKYKDDAIKIIELLNKKCDKSYRPTPNNLKFIVARLKEYKYEDLAKVIALKCMDPFFQANDFKFMRPSTIFNATNFENYIEEVKKYERESV